ncbi:MAG TPA: hypothetical protein VMU12_02840 [Candidatus Paceibacterota bacterium]|nr:hypothetical protein [Candidatus Paceibacterota bacterium]
MKFGPIGRVVALCALIVAVVGAIAYLERVPSRRLASLFGVSVTVSDLHSPSPSPTPSVIALSDRLPALSIGSVAVQTFSGSTLVRTAAATAVTSDGLFVTTSAAAPYGSGSFVYQIATSQGSVVRARRVAYDAVAGLVLLKADNIDVGTVAFSADAQIRAGDELDAVGATFALSHYVPVVLPLSVVYSPDGTSAVLSYDRTFTNLLAGARIVDGDGHAVGIFSGTSAGIVGATSINAFIDGYLGQTR